MSFSEPTKSIRFAVKILTLLRKRRHIVHHCQRGQLWDYNSLMLHLSAVFHYTMSRGLIIVFLQDQQHTHSAGFTGIIFIRRHLLRSWRPPFYMPPLSPSSSTLSIFYDYYFFKLLCVDCSVLPCLTIHVWMADEKRAATLGYVGGGVYNTYWSHKMQYFIWKKKNDNSGPECIAGGTVKRVTSTLWYVNSCLCFLWTKVCTVRL